MSYIIYFYLFFLKCCICITLKFHFLFICGCVHGVPMFSYDGLICGYNVPAIYFQRRHKPSVVEMTTRLEYIRVTSHLPASTCLNSNLLVWTRMHSLKWVFSSSFNRIRSSSNAKKSIRNYSYYSSYPLGSLNNGLLRVWNFYYSFGVPVSLAFYNFYYLFKALACTCTGKIFPNRIIAATSLDIVKIILGSILNLNNLLCNNNFQEHPIYLVFIVHYLLLVLIVLIVP